MLITILFATILGGCWIWIGYHLITQHKKDEMKDDINDPTTTFWHEDD